MHLPRSLKLQIVPKLKPFGIGDIPRIEAVWHSRTPYRSRALYTRRETSALTA